MNEIDLNSIGAHWWMTAIRQQRIALMREMGFCDVRAYAGYRWQDFAPHTRVEIDKIIGDRQKCQKSPTPTRKK